MNKSKKVLKKIVATGLTLALTVGLTACSVSKEIPKITISLWIDERKVDLLSEAMEEFKELHKDEVDISYTVSEEGEDTCRETVLANIEGAADIYAFASDQLGALAGAGALLDISSNYEGGDEEFLEPYGGVDSGVGQAVLYDDKIYACPETASNGYFLYYNKKYLTDTDVETMDGMLSKVRGQNKKFTMDYSSGWYIYSFFKGAGLNLEINPDGKTNFCNWNATDTPHTGVSVAESMLNIAKDSGFVDLGDDGFVEGVESGEVVAGINGAWNADKIAKAWGDDMAATKLPTYTIDGEQVQMCSFTGYKFLGINAYAENPDWCMKFVRFFTDKDYQIKEFQTTGEAPANQEAAATSEVQNSPAVAALAEQAQFGYVQNVADSFWDASNKFGVTISAGNRDGRDLQELLDKLVKETTEAKEE